MASRVWAWAAITALVLGIGAADTDIGIEISLAVFYLVPISFATAWFGLAAGAAIALVCTIARILSDLWIVYPADLPGHTWWNAAASLLIFLFIVRLLHTLLTLQRNLLQVVKTRTSELVVTVADRARLQQELLDVSEKERSSIGRELHDELGQQLVATALAAQALAQKLPDESAAEEARMIVRWIEEAVASARKIARGLILTRVEPERFAQELEDLAAESTQGGVKCQVHNIHQPLAADATECAQLFRIAQEAVNNAWRHAHATTIDITLGGDAQSLCLIVEDDGRGMAVPADRTSPGLGLRTMEHRARAIGATLSVLSSPGEGTKIICQLQRLTPSSHERSSDARLHR